MTALNQVQGVRHKHYDLLTAIANGEQMQCEVLIEKGKPDRQWKDCNGHTALSHIISSDQWYSVRIKPKTYTV